MSAAGPKPPEGLFGKFSHAAGVVASKAASNVGKIGAWNTIRKIESEIAVAANDRSKQNIGVTKLNEQIEEVKQALGQDHPTPDQVREGIKVIYQISLAIPTSIILPGKEAHKLQENFNQILGLLSKLEVNNQSPKETLYLVKIYSRVSSTANQLNKTLPKDRKIQIEVFNNLAARHLEQLVKNPDVPKDDSTFTTFVEILLEQPEKTIFKALVKLLPEETTRVEFIKYLFDKTSDKDLKEKVVVSLFEGAKDEESCQHFYKGYKSAMGTRVIYPDHIYEFVCRALPNAENPEFLAKYFTNSSSFTTDLNHIRARSPEVVRQALVHLIGSTPDSSKVQELLDYAKKEPPEHLLGIFSNALSNAGPLQKQMIIQEVHQGIVFDTSTDQFTSLAILLNNYHDVPDNKKEIVHTKTMEMTQAILQEKTLTADRLNSASELFLNLLKNNRTETEELQTIFDTLKQKYLELIQNTKLPGEKQKIAAQFTRHLFKFDDIYIDRFSPIEDQLRSPATLQVKLEAMESKGLFKNDLALSLSIRELHADFVLLDSCYDGDKNKLKEGLHNRIDLLVAYPPEEQAQLEQQLETITFQVSQISSFTNPLLRRQYNEKLAEARRLLTDSTLGTINVKNMLVTTLADPTIQAAAEGHNSQWAKDSNRSSTAIGDFQRAIGGTWQEAVEEISKEMEALLGDLVTKQERKRELESLLTQANAPAMNYYLVNKHTLSSLSKEEQLMMRVCKAETQPVGYQDSEGTPNQAPFFLVKREGDQLHVAVCYRFITRNSSKKHPIGVVATGYEMTFNLNQVDKLGWNNALVKDQFIDSGHISLKEVTLGETFPLAFDSDNKHMTAEEQIFALKSKLEGLLAVDEVQSPINKQLFEKFPEDSIYRKNVLPRFKS